MWNQQTIAWYADALQYTGFDRALADALQPYLNKNETICDLGCGIGYLALELARRGYSVDAVDKSADAMEWLKRQIQVLGHQRLQAFAQDWTSLPEGTCWDTVIMVSAGGFHDYSHYLKFCKKQLIFVDRVRVESHAAPWTASPRSEAYLQRNASACGIRQQISLEFGQPFRSEQEAQMYFQCYYGQASIQRAAEKLVTTGRTDFPLYLPYRKDLEILVIPKGGN